MIYYQDRGMGFLSLEAIKINYMEYKDVTLKIQNKK